MSRDFVISNFEIDFLFLIYEYIFKGFFLQIKNEVLSTFRFKFIDSMILRLKYFHAEAQDFEDIRELVREKKLNMQCHQHC